MTVRDNEIDGGVTTLPALTENYSHETNTNALGTYRYEELLNMQVPPRRYVVEGLAAEGEIGILAAAYGLGKTYLALQLTQHLAAGRDFLGRQVGRAYRVAYIDTENGLAEMVPRLQAQRDALNMTPAEMKLINDNFRLLDAQQPGPMQFLKLDKEGFESLQAYVSSERFEVLIIDNFGKVFLGAETDEERVKAFLRGLQKLIAACPSLQNGLILFLHHPTKPNPELKLNLLCNPREWLSKVRGTGRLLDLVQVRLGFDEGNVCGETYYVINGIMRSATVQPMILQRDDAIFTPHPDKDLKRKELFASAPKQAALFDLAPTSFRFKDLEALVGSDGKRFHKDTIAEMLRTAVANALLIKHSDGYQKL